MEHWVEIPVISTFFVIDGQKIFMEKAMNYSGIGGQAVMEGVMMKKGDAYAVAVRKPNGEITVEASEYSGVISNQTIKKLPVVRGICSFLESLTLGFRTLSYSASFFEEEEEPANPKKEDLLMKLTLAVSVAFAIGVFMLLPYGISLLFRDMIASRWLMALLEGALRLVIFLGYVAGISRLSDIRRVYMYHGAEHKCINCIESGMDLTVANVRKSSRLHKRCGTSFLLVVMFVSILFFLFIQADSPLLRLFLRVLFVPVIAGVSYEFIRLAGRSDNRFVNLISAPGLLLQRITTKEPEDAMIEVGIASVEAVFDWRAYLREMRSDAGKDGGA